jgi:hypothetical protein
MSIDAPATLGELIARRKSVEFSRQQMDFSFADGADGVAASVAPPSHSSAYDSAPRSTQLSGFSAWAGNLRESLRKLLNR